MANFKLSGNGNNFVLDTAGKVSNSAGQFIGSWNTDNNQVVIRQTPAAGGQIPDPINIPVKWVFNTKNQFCIQDSDGNELLNFNSDAKVFPEYELRDARLRVTPDMTNGFQFFIVGDWSVTDDHSLKFTIGGVTSTIDGFLADTKSRFIYSFRDKERAFLSSRLTFAGRWNQQIVDGIPKMKFLYKILDGTERAFDLPGKLVITKGSNQFKYNYEKDNRSFGITFLGFISINENLTITYSLDKQSSSTGDELVASTTFTMQATFSGKQFEGDLNLVLVRDDGKPGTYDLAITGEYTGVIGSTTVMVGFRFSQVRANGKVTRTFGIAGKFVLNNGQISYELDFDGTTVDLTLGLDVRLKNGGSANAKLNVNATNGQIKSISFLLGISF